MQTWTIIDRSTPGKVSGVAAERLFRALDTSGIRYLRVSTWTGAFAPNTLLLAPNIDAMVYNIADEILTAPESLQLFRQGNVRVATGSDERGFAYAVMELAERIEAEGEGALLDLDYEAASPTVSVRGIDRLVVNTSDEAWWMSEGYWRSYLMEMLAARFNRLVLLVGFDTSYFSPPYPYFVEVPEYPNVHVNDPSIRRDAYRAALTRLCELAHEYGMDFTFATWQQTNWLASQTSKVDGIEDLMLYCSAGIRELTLQFPGIDTIQLRVNHEAGVGTQVTAEEYWYKQLDGLAEAVKRGANTKLELRAKGLTDAMIRYAKELGLDLTVSTKYWCEHAGLPYHLTRMRTEELTRLDNFNHSRRYSYSDMLKKPRLHKFLYRLWNDGSTDLFTWGDPDYVRRFVASMDLGNADGFEIMPMLSLKGGPQDGSYTGWALFDDPAYQPEGYEDSRYWLCNRLFGRIGYDIDESEQAWMRPMRLRFGASAEPLMAAISAGSRLLPFIVGFHMPVHPQLHYWPEFNPGAALFSQNNHNAIMKKVGVTYQSTEPGDAGLFYPVDEYAKHSMQSTLDGRYTPCQIAGELVCIAANTKKYLDKARETGLPDTSEARGVELDLSMLIELALYHHDKILSALELCLYNETGKETHLNESLALMRAARAHWSDMAELGQKYHKHLVFYVGDRNLCREGNWKDFLPEMDADIASLIELGASDASSLVKSYPSAFGLPALAWECDVPDVCVAGESLLIHLTTGPNDALLGGVTLRYRHTNQMEGSFNSLPMTLANGVWTAEIPAAYIQPEWDLLLYFDAVSIDGGGLAFPGVWHPQHPLPYFIVEVLDAG